MHRGLSFSTDRHFTPIFLSSHFPKPLIVFLLLLKAFLFLNAVINSTSHVVLIGISKMGSSNSKPKNPNSNALKVGIKEALGHNEHLYAFPGRALYMIRDVHPYNSDRPVKPACITYPRTTAEVSAIVKCAASLNYKVQPRSGGHSYANYCTSSFPFQIFKTDGMQASAGWMELWWWI